MYNMIEDILTLARQGDTIENPEKIRIQNVARDAWSVVDTPNGDLKFNTDLMVTADPDRLSNLFENLIRNAFEHAGADTTVFVGELDNEDGFFVADDGPGIPEDIQDEVFASGFTTNDDGTGFGLNIVSEIVEAHNWTISLGDDSRFGAVFEIRF